MYGKETKKWKLVGSHWIWVHSCFLGLRVFGVLETEHSSPSLRWINVTSAEAETHLHLTSVRWPVQSELSVLMQFLVKKRMHGILHCFTQEFRHWCGLSWDTFWRQKRGSQMWSVAHQKAFETLPKQICVWNSILTFLLNYSFTDILFRDMSTCKSKCTTKNV